MEWTKFNRKYSASGGWGEGGDFTEYLRTAVLPVKYLKFYKSYCTKTQSTQTNQHLSHHLSQPAHLGTYPKTIMGKDMDATILKKTLIN